MVSHNGPCDSNRLREFLESPPSEDGDSCDLAQHLEHCEKCRGELEGMAGGRWWNEVRPFVRAAEGDDPALCTQPVAAQGAADADLSFLSPPDQPGHLGRFGPYQVLGLLGKGGMGVVLKAWDPALRRTVAIKVLSPLLATSGPSRQRFTREAQAAAAVVHHHVVAIFHIDTDKASGLPYLVMPCIVGRSLQERIDREGPLDVTAILRIGTQAAAGLAAAHAQGIVHRDVKPANILLENGVERVVLTDFGLARAVDDASLTQSGVIAGTPQYMSPEQARGDLADHRSDLFSLGSVLYAMCTGRPPFRATSALAVLRRVSDEYARPIHDLNPAVPEGLVAVIEKLHAKDPAERYQTASEAAAALGQLLADLQKPSRRPAALPAARRKALPRRRGWQPALVGAAALILALLAGIYVGSPSRERFVDRMSVQPLASAATVTPCAAGACADEQDRDDQPEVPAVPAIPAIPAIPPIPGIPQIVIDGPFVRFDTSGDFSVHVNVDIGTAGETVVGSGKVETRNYKLKDFSAVEVRAPFTVDLKQGKEFKVSVTTDDNMFDHLRVEKDGKKLVLGFKEQHVSVHMNREDALKAEITLPELDDLYLNGAARATAQDFQSAGPFHLRTTGAAHFQGSVKAADVTIDANGASTIKLAGAGKNVRIKVNGASKVKMSDFATAGERLIVDANGASFVILKGAATAGVLKAGGASHLELGEMKLAGADVTLVGASHANVNVSEKLDYSLTAASNLTYAGDPTIGKSSKSGGSHVSQK
jgi:eukaryotic-like serine/threonine-protein kinase